MIKKKIKTPDQLAKLFSKKFRESQKIVFTNGCFDILHTGHVSYLERAKAVGTVLVLAVNSDSSVRQLKGPARPINKLKDRMWVLAALESVDYVTSFSDENPERLIRKLKPNVLVKGGDWKPSQIIGADFVLANGGKVKSLPFVEGRSTTKIIEKAKKNS